MLCVDILDSVIRMIVRWFNGEGLFQNILTDSASASSGKFGPGYGPIPTNYTNCTGSEPTLWRSCGSLSNSRRIECSHEEDIGVICQPGASI